MLLICLLSILPFLVSAIEQQDEKLPSDSTKDMNSFGKYSGS